MQNSGALEGHGVRLRSWRAEDTEAVEAIRSDAVVRRWSALPDEEAAAWLDRQIHRVDGVSLAVTNPPDETALGKVALGQYAPSVRRAELSYWMVPLARGRGLAVAACRTLCDWGFASLGLESIVLDIEFDNEASNGVARRLGALPTPGPPRVEFDRAGIPRQLITFVVCPS